MSLKVRLFNSCRAGIGLSLVGLLLGYASAPASSQQWTSAKQKEHSELVDKILATDAELGSVAWRILKLTQSPRKHELVKLPGGSRTLQAFVVYPETKENVPVIVMLPEDQGLTDWARMMADELSAMGNIVIVPDLLAGFGPNGGGHDSFPDKKSVLMAVDDLTTDGIMADMNAWADYGKKLPQSNGKLAAIGFGWGAGKTFWFATQRKDLSATFIFYDWAPPGTPLAGITAPVYGFYAENDPRVIKSLDATKATMASLGKKFEPVMYPGSDHMFVRVGEMPADKNPANFHARCLSLARLQDLLKGL
jgi:carboxymethylenebutenolidase